MPGGSVNALAPFHLVQLANASVTAVRRRVIWEQKGRRGRKIDPAWANRRRLLTGRERLSHKGFSTMWNALMDSEPTGQVLTAWIGKEELRALFALARTNSTRDQIAARLYRFYAWCAASDLPELHPRQYRRDLVASHRGLFLKTRPTNARTEGINRLAKQVKRSACGFRNPANGHRRIRFHCTRTQWAATAASRTLPAQV